MDGLIALALAKKGIKGVTKSIAEEYDPTKEYDEGALVIKDGKLQKYVDGEWVETVITDNIGGGDIVQSEEEYVGEVVGGTNAPIDKTLKIDGAAADSKVVGDKFTKLINKRKLSDYLYEMQCDYPNYDAAYKYFEEHSPEVNVGACSSVRNGNFYGRNFDWKYDNSVEFVVHTIGNSERYESYAVSGSVNGITKNIVESGAYSEYYDIIPFMLVDGINEKGLVVNSNVVPSSNTGASVPTDDTEVTINNMMVIRYLLDHFDNAASAADYMQKHMAIVPYAPLVEHGYELHWMIADKTNTYVVEVIENAVEIIDVTSNPYMTNFNLYDVTFNSDNSVYTPYTQDSTHSATTTNGITPLGSGLERWNIIAENYSGANTKAGMRSLMESLSYTNAYTIDDADSVWYTEFVGIDNLQCDSPYTDFTDVVDAARSEYAERLRETGTTWQTVHSSVYDIENKKMYIIVQEGYEELAFEIKTIKEVEVDATLSIAGAAADAKATGDAIASVNVLPEVEGSGKALISVNGEWVEQEGYGYSSKEKLVDEKISTIDQTRYRFCRIETRFTLTPGTKYSVVYNNVVYDDLICRYDDYAYANIIGGNPYDILTGITSTYPFYISGDGTNGSLFTIDNLWTIDLIVYEYSSSKLDKKYLINSNIENGTGLNSIKEGNSTTASGLCSHAEGDSTTASGSCSHAEGNNTYAYSKNSHVEGTYNVIDYSNKYAHIIGNGTGTSTRHNALMVGWDGSIHVQSANDTTKMMGLTINKDGSIVTKDDNNGTPHTIKEVAIDNTLATQGAAADAKAVGDAIAAINVLPPVTIDDDGKVLGVVDGEWSSINLGSVFKLKGSVATVDNLPTTGNEIGDVYYVIASSVGYIWLNDGTENRWEQLGLAIDLSQYATTQYVDQKIGEIESILETI